MLKAYKYRIYPNKEQKIQIAKTFGCCRFVYNQTLAYRKESYEKERKPVGKIDCNNSGIIIKQQYYGQVNSKNAAGDTAALHFPICLVRHIFAFFANRCYN